MKVLVTGGAGFIGSNIVDKLIELGNTVIVVDNESTDCHETFYWNDHAENYKYDICDYDKIEPLFNGVDCVFHLAAEARIQPSIQNPTLTAKTNVYGTCNVLQAAKENDVKRFVYSSTSASYGLKNVAPVDENMTPDCLNAYSITKCAGEDLCKMFHRMYGMETVIFRYFNVYGERQPIRGQYAPVIGLFMRQCSEGNPMTVVGDGKQRRDFTYVGDIIRANMLAAESENPDILGEIFNVGTGSNHSVLDVANIIEGETKFIPDRPGEARETLADLTKSRELLGYEPSVKLEEWIKSYEA